MTEYEMRKIAKMQADFIVEAVKGDSALADVLFPPKCMSIDEAAEYLRIPKKTLYNKIDEIPHEKVGRRLVFTDRGLIRWMKRKCNRVVSLDIPVRKVM